jgi:hypothetical protein
MSNFRQKLKMLLESSFHDIKKINSIYRKNITRNNDKFETNIINIKDYSHLNIPEKIKYKNKNRSFITSINNYNNRETEKISLYKKYKKYNSIFNKPKKIICNNILDSYKMDENKKTRHIFDYPVSSQMLVKNRRFSNSISTNNLTVDSVINKNNENNNYNNNHKINYRNVNYIDYKMNKIKKKKNSSNRVGNKIIQKIELIENENKENKVKNLLINRSPIVFNNTIYKSSNCSYTYYISKSRNDSKNKQKNIKKNTNFLDLDDLKDIISSIKNKKYTIIKNKEFNNLNK